LCTILYQEILTIQYLLDKTVDNVLIVGEHKTWSHDYPTTIQDSITDVKESNFR